jgi:hypothetical protein
MMTLTVRWDYLPGDPPKVAYYIDDAAVGEDDSGFDRILQMIRSQKDVQVTLSIRQLNALGGQSLRDSLPFGKRFDELSEAAGDNKIVYDFGSR